MNAIHTVSFVAFTIACTSFTYPSKTLAWKKYSDTIQRYFINIILYADGMHGQVTKVRTLLFHIKYDTKIKIYELAIIKHFYFVHQTTFKSKVVSERGVLLKTSKCINKRNDMLQGLVFHSKHSKSILRIRKMCSSVPKNREFNCIQLANLLNT